MGKLFKAVNKLTLGGYLLDKQYQKEKKKAVRKANAANAANAAKLSAAEEKNRAQELQLAQMRGSLFALQEQKDESALGNPLSRW